MSVAQKFDAPATPVEAVRVGVAQTTAIGILFAVSASHMLNDMMQSLAPALYPVFRDTYSLSFFQTGMITFVFQVTASLLQPFIGMFTDRRPVPFALPSAMAFTLLGLVLLAFSTSYPMLLGSVALIGVGSAIFHPEASRVARAASGGRHGFAQSLFQVGGNFGQSLGPLMAAFIVVPGGQRSVLAFTALAFVAILILSRVAQWYLAHRAQKKAPVALRRLRACRARSSFGRWSSWSCCCSRRRSISRASAAITRSISSRRLACPCRPRRSCCSFSSARSRREPSSAGRSAIASGANT